MLYVIKPVNSYNVYVMKGEMIGESEYIADGCSLKEAYHFFTLEEAEKVKKLMRKEYQEDFEIVFIDKHGKENINIQKCYEELQEILEKYNCCILSETDSNVSNRALLVDNNTDDEICLYDEY